jgi:hypothetical protein
VTAAQQVLQRLPGATIARYAAALAAAATAAAAVAAAPVIDPATALAAFVFAAACVWFATQRRVTVSLAVLLLYLGLVDGVLKLEVNRPIVTLVRDAFVVAILVGVLARQAVTHRRVKAPPGAAWALAFVVVIVAQLANPSSTLHQAVPGLRPHLEWVVLFFFGAAVLSGERRIRVFLLLLVIVAAINGVASVVQFNLTPAQFASWGPGYNERVIGTGAFSGGTRTYFTATAHRVRPFGLGSDTGFGGYVGLLAVPAVLALLSEARRHRDRALLAILGVAVVAGVLTSQARSAVAATVIAAAAFAFIAARSGRTLRLSVGIALLLLSVFAVVHFAGQGSSSAFARYSSIAPGKIVGAARADRPGTLDRLPQYFTQLPVGSGLGRSGPAAVLDYGSAEQAAQFAADARHGVGPNAESEITYLISEAGLPAFGVLLGFSLAGIIAGIRAARRVRDPHTRLLLAALTAPLIGILALWPVTSTSATTPFAPYLWFVGAALLWWAHAGRSTSREV